MIRGLAQFMNKTLSMVKAGLTSVFICLFLMLFYIKPALAIKEEVISHKTFGKTVIYIPETTPTSVALFVSGDGGWQAGVINMAKNLALQGALVAGIDAKQYMAFLSRSSSSCYYPAADFEQLSMMLQKKYKFSSYTKPVLVGYSYGATLVYGLLAQAPAGTFKGAIALGFCPDITLKKPLCKGNGLKSHVLVPGKSYYLERTEKLAAPFIALNGIKDETCPFQATKTFLTGMPFAELVTLPKVGHGFSIADNWLPQFYKSYKKIIASPSAIERKNAASIQRIPDKLITALPLNLLPATSSDNQPLVFMMSGDGGWTSFDQSLAESFTEKGMAVVGLDAQKYFWNAKTPKQTAAAIADAISYYMQSWKKKKFILAGYSFGACIAPFIANRFPENLQHNLSAICMLSPDERADFEIHVADMLSIDEQDEPYNVLAEMKKARAFKLIVMFGDDEDPATTKQFRQETSRVITLPGGHHYNNDYTGIVNYVIKSL